MCSFLDDAQAQQAELIRGSNGPAGEGYYVAPTLVVNPDAKLRLTREEVFGPVVNLVRVADGEEALQLANDTEYGLTASVWTQISPRLWNIAIAYRQDGVGKQPYLN
ncbi:phenylacetaldehyde dehydrogenase [Escherichia coli]|uniref:Phenylacetaldehyde dehydrogenase n=1 Tax=Escherichia coli TaxID=562 RepID=A0A377D1R8_ECOLX|nr:phenylacetaldehyde dehydrogenase [Escherichia coli]